MWSYNRIFLFVWLTSLSMIISGPRDRIEFWLVKVSLSSVQPLVSHIVRVLDKVESLQARVDEWEWACLWSNSPGKARLRGCWAQNLVFADSRIRVNEWQFQGEIFLSNTTQRCLKTCCFFFRGMGSLALVIFRHNDQCEACSTHDSQVSLTYEPYGKGLSEYKSCGLLQIFACSVINELTSGVKQEGTKLIKSLWDKKRICHARTFLKLNMTGKENRHALASGRGRQPISPL